jgi:hypothetical protein
MVAGKCRAPVVQHALQLAGGALWQDEVFRNVSQSIAVQRCLEDLRHRLENALAIDVHLHVLVILREPPCVEGAMGWQSHVHAVMTGQITRNLRPRSAREIRRRAHDYHAYVWRYAHCHHVFGDLVAETNSRIVALVHDIDEPYLMLISILTSG